VTFYDVISYAGVLAIGLLLGRYGARSWRDANARLDQLLAEHRAEQKQCVGLDIIPTPITALPYRRRPRDRFTFQRRRWDDFHDVFPDDLPQREPCRVPDGPTLELAQLADDEAMERLADLPHFRQQEQSQP
jgi:hypothetical protein